MRPSPLTVFVTRWRVLSLFDLCRFEDNLLSWKTALIHSTKFFKMSQYRASLQVLLRCLYNHSFSVSFSFTATFLLSTRSRLNALQQLSLSVSHDHAFFVVQYLFLFLPFFVLLHILLHSCTNSISVVHISINHIPRLR